jgi:hypothetical protein
VPAPATRPAGRAGTAALGRSRRHFQGLRQLRCTARQTIKAINQSRAQNQNIKKKKKKKKKAGQGESSLQALQTKIIKIKMNKAEKKRYKRHADVE